MRRDAIPYHILIIRLWPEQAEQTAPRWRITLDAPADDARQGFTDVRALLDEVEQTLTALMNEQVPPDESTPPQLPS